MLALEKSLLSEALIVNKTRLVQLITVQKIIWKQSNEIRTMLEDFKAKWTNMSQLLMEYQAVKGNYCDSSKKYARFYAGISSKG